MNWFESFIYGLVSGITEFLPVPSLSHQKILSQLFGVSGNDPVCDLIVHISMLLALLLSTHRLLLRLRRERLVAQRSRRRSNGTDIRASFDNRLIRGAVVPMLLVMLILIFTRAWTAKPLVVIGFTALNGILLFLGERLPHANKDSRHMSILDAVVFGIFGALSVFPGISRIGASQTYATMRGAEKQHSMNWALVLSIPALLILCVFDVVAVISGIAPVQKMATFFGYVMVAIGAFIGTYLCTAFIRKAIGRLNSAVFAYYCWGIALLLLVLYLIS
jgi:undecaprenyl-diphosphatase